jgi:hypothetical protein
MENAIVSSVNPPKKGDAIELSEFYSQGKESKNSGVKLIEKCDTYMPQ